MKTKLLNVSWVFLAIFSLWLILYQLKVKLAEEVFEYYILGIALPIIFLIIGGLCLLPSIFNPGPEGIFRSKSKNDSLPLDKWAFPTDEEGVEN